MKLSNKVYRFQEGGPMPQEAGAPVEGAPMGAESAPAGGQEEAMQQLAGMAQEIIQQLGPDAAAALFQIGLEMLQGGAQGGEQLPPEEAQPAFQRMGGRMTRIR